MLSVIGVDAMLRQSGVDAMLRDILLGSLPLAENPKQASAHPPAPTLCWPALGCINFFSLFFSFFLEQRAPRERAPSSELRLEGKGVKRTRETVVPFAKLKKKFQARKLENVLLHHIHVDEMKKS